MNSTVSPTIPPGSQGGGQGKPSTLPPLSPTLGVAAHRLSEAIDNVRAEAIERGAAISPKQVIERIVASYLGMNHEDLYVSLNEARLGAAMAFLSQMIHNFRSGDLPLNCFENARQRASREPTGTVRAPLLTAMLASAEAQGYNVDEFRGELEYMKGVVGNSLLFLNLIRKEAEAAFASVGLDADLALRDARRMSAEDGIPCLCHDHGATP